MFVLCPVDAIRSPETAFVLKTWETLQRFLFYLFIIILVKHIPSCIIDFFNRFAQMFPACTRALADF